MLPSITDFKLERKSTHFLSGWALNLTHWFPCFRYKSKSLLPMIQAHSVFSAHLTNYSTLHHASGSAWAAFSMLVSMPMMQMISHRCILHHRVQRHSPCSISDISRRIVDSRIPTACDRLASITLADCKSEGHPNPLHFLNINRIDCLWFFSAFLYIYMCVYIFFITVLFQILWDFVIISQQNHLTIEVNSDALCNVCIYVYTSVCTIHPDITITVDWALKANYLPVCLSVCLSIYLSICLSLSLFLYHFTIVIVLLKLPVWLWLWVWHL